ncbi:hypothetical protein MKZ15_05780 [Paenibacillus sp. FSL R7-0216]|uniref:hypothetical protein n=1 Tax=Paenibacillus sp. FSL R7-0216 TaxID=2921677 RepID=UPI0030D90FA4
MGKQIKIVQVAFNVLDPDQLQQYEHVRQRPNQSGYIKRLVQRDIDGGARGVAAVVNEVSRDNFELEGFI